MPTVARSDRSHQDDSQKKRPVEAEAWKACAFTAITSSSFSKPIYGFSDMSFG